ncbi:hypothetical protein Peur_066898 [Populus x canadensis]
MLLTISSANLLKRRLSTVKGCGAGIPEYINRVGERTTKNLNYEASSDNGWAKWFEDGHMNSYPELTVGAGRHSDMGRLTARWH